MSADRPEKKVFAKFYREQESGREPVKEALLGISKEERVLVAIDIRKMEYGWPIGMPTCRSLKGGLYEIRTTLPNRIFRVLLRFGSDGNPILLHAFIKKTQKTPNEDIKLAKQRWKKCED